MTAVVCAQGIAHGSVRVTNSGKVRGAEVVQLYIAPPKGGLFRPEEELRGFARVEPEPGKAKQLSLHWTSAALPFGLTAGRFPAEPILSASVRPAGISACGQKQKSAANLSQFRYGRPGAGTRHRKPNMANGHFCRGVAAMLKKQ